MASYPGEIAALNNPESHNYLDQAGLEHDVQHANANDEIEAIETELGTHPSGTFSNVKERFDKTSSYRSINVKGYGALGNGSQDDTTFIQSALSALSPGGGMSGGECYLPDGIYRITSKIVIPKGVSFGADSSNVVTIYADFTDGPVIEIQGGSSSYSSHSGKGRVHNIKISGVGGSNTRTGISLRNASDVLIDGVEIEHQDCGLDIYGTRGLSVERCKFKSCGPEQNTGKSAVRIRSTSDVSDTVLSKHISFNECSFESSHKQVVQITGVGGQVDDVTFRKCSFYEDTVSGTGARIHVENGYNIHFNNCSWDIVNFEVGSTTQVDVFRVKQTEFVSINGSFETSSVEVVNNIITMDGSEPNYAVNITGAVSLGSPLGGGVIEWIGENYEVGHIDVQIIEPATPPTTQENIYIGSPTTQSWHRDVTVLGKRTIGAEEEVNALYVKGIGETTSESNGLSQYSGLKITSTPVLSNPLGVLRGLKIETFPAASSDNSPDLTEGLTVDASAGAGLSAPIVQGLSVGVKAVGGSITDATGVKISATALFGSISKAVAIRVDEGGLAAADENWFIKAGNYRSQIMGSVAIGGASIDAAPAAKSILDLQSTSQAFVLPRLDEPARDGIAGDTINGMVVFNTDANTAELYGKGVWNDITGRIRHSEGTGEDYHPLVVSNDVGLGTYKRFVIEANPPVEASAITAVDYVDSTGVFNTTSSPELTNGKHGMATGTLIRFVSFTVANGLDLTPANYYVVWESETSFKVADTRENARLGVTLALTSSGVCEYSVVDQNVDMNIRSAVLEIGNRDVEASAPGTQVRMFKAPYEKSNYITAYHAGATPDDDYVAWRFGAGGTLTLGVGGKASTALEIKNSTLDYADMSINEDGKISWSTGSATPDTYLERSTQGVLKATGTRVWAVEGVTTKTKAGTPSDADWTAATPDTGTIVVDTSANRLWIRTGDATWKYVSLT